MSSYTTKKFDTDLQCPKWLPNNVQYECRMGSQAYGVSNADSDIDLYGFCIPPKESIFPHLAGEIEGFGRQKQKFKQWQQHKLFMNGDEYDFSIYNIVRYFTLCMECNPNMIDSLFVPIECITHSTHIGNHVRDNRRLFLHKGCWHKFKGYAYSQLHKIDSKSPDIGTERHALREKYGYDVKFAYHVVRLMGEVAEILETGNLTLNEKSRREHMKAIRKGEVKKEDIKKWFSEQESHLETLYHNTKAIPHSPPEGRIKNLLMECLEQHYGNLDAVIKNAKVSDSDEILRKVRELVKE